MYIIKTCTCNIQRFFSTLKIEKIHQKIVYVFLKFPQNIDCWYTLERRTCIVLIQYEIITLSQHTLLTLHVYMYFPYVISFYTSASLCGETATHYENLQYTETFLLVVKIEIFHRTKIDIHNENLPMQYTEIFFCCKK